MFNCDSTAQVSWQAIEAYSKEILNQSQHYARVLILDRHFDDLSQHHFDFSLTALDQFFGQLQKEHHHQEKTGDYKTFDSDSKEVKQDQDFDQGTDQDPDQDPDQFSQEEQPVRARYIFLVWNQRVFFIEIKDQVEFELQITELNADLFLLWNYYFSWKGPQVCLFWPLLTICYQHIKGLSSTWNHRYLQGPVIHPLQTVEQHLIEWVRVNYWQFVFLDSDQVRELYLELERQGETSTYFSFMLLADSLRVRRWPSWVEFRMSTTSWINKQLEWHHGNEGYIRLKSAFLCDYESDIKMSQDEEDPERELYQLCELAQSRLEVFTSVLNVDVPQVSMRTKHFKISFV